MRHAIPFTAKRDSEKHYWLQNATRHAISKLILVSCYQSSIIIDCKERFCYWLKIAIFKCDFIIDCKTRILLLTKTRVFNCICKTSIIDCKMRILLLTEKRVFNCICKTSIIDCKARFLSIIQLYLQNASNVRHANGHSLSWTRGIVVWGHI